MRGLAIETSSRIGSVALVEDGRPLGQITFQHGLQHAAKIVLAIDQLCAGQGWQPVDIREIYVSAGPGSFTGLRIGITLAKTLAFVTGAKLVAVPSLRVLAENAPSEAQHLILVIDAKRSQIYTARFQKEARQTRGVEWRKIEPPHLDSLAEMLARSPRPVHLLGEGIPYHRQFVDAGDSQIIMTDETTWRPRAEATAKLGWELARAGAFTDPFQLTPIYIRRAEAEEKLDAKIAGESAERSV